MYSEHAYSYKDKKGKRAYISRASSSKSHLKDFLTRFIHMYALESLMETLDIKLPRSIIKNASHLVKRAGLISAVYAVNHRDGAK